jgi:hypothetical protein
MATSIATGALPPRVAVALSGLLNLVGAFLSLAVAATIASGLVNTAEVTLQVVAAGRRQRPGPGHRRDLLPGHPGRPRMGIYEVYQIGHPAPAKH